MSYTVEDLCDRGVKPPMLLLLGRIQKRATATYGEVARMLERELELGDHKVFPTHIGAVAGSLMDLILTKYKTAPLINSLIVAQSDGLPGRGCFGFIDNRLKKRKGSVELMLQAERFALIHKMWNDVFDYSKWDEVFEGIFDHSPEADATGLERFAERDGRPEGWGGRGGGESEQHKRLKLYVLEHPGCIGAAKSDVRLRTTEQPLLSGDSVDVFLSTGRISYLVEVKSILSSEDDLKRGIYQCLKYGVVLAAQQEKHFTAEDVVATLVTERDLPSDLLELARRLGVKTCTVCVN